MICVQHRRLQRFKSVNLYFITNLSLYRVQKLLRCNYKSFNFKNKNSL